MCEQFFQVIYYLKTATSQMGGTKVLCGRYLQEGSKRVAHHISRFLGVDSGGGSVMQHNSSAPLLLIGQLDTVGVAVCLDACDPCRRILVRRSNIPSTLRICSIEYC